ncbi:MAG: hypothetical protein R8G01_03835 [Ilumatobacteraceae bacterium]|nr:hypothetical protein [Ilumatobacteraceae bacterium]
MMDLIRRRPVRVGAAVAVLPLVVALVALLWRPWFPVLDLAMTEFRVRDVGGRFTPRIGLPGRIGEFPDQGSHPGPWSFYLVAPFYRLAGASAWGLQFGSVVVNSAAFVGVVAIGRRTGGAVGALAMAAVAAVAIRGFGLNVLTHPWNPYFPLALWLLLLVAAWAVLAGDHRLAVVVAFCGSIATQTHVPYLLSCVLVSLLVLASLLRTWLMSSGDELAAVRNSTLLALGVTVLLWLPPLVEQLRRDPGNMTMLWRHFTGEPDEPMVSVATAVEVFLRHLDVFGAGWSLLTSTDGFVVRSSVPVESAGTGSVIVGFLVLFVWIVAALTAFKMRVDVLNALNLVLAVALGAGLVSMTRILGKVWFYLTLWAWMTLLLVVVSVLWTAVEFVRRRAELPDEWLRAAAVTTLVGSTVLSLGAVAVQEVPERTQSEGLRAIVAPTVEAIDDGLGAAVGRDGTYLVTWQDAMYIGSQGYGLVNELERRGIDAGVRDPWRVPVTPHRVLPPGTIDAELHLVSGPYIDEWRERAGYVEVIAVDLRTDDEHDRFDELRERVGVRLEQLGRTDLVEVVDRNLFGASLDPDLPRDVVDDLSEMLLLGAPLAVFIAPAGTTG